MYDATDLGAHAIDEGVHLDFARNLAPSLEFLAVEIDEDEIFGLHHPLADTRGSGEDHAPVDAGGDIAIHRGHEALRVQQLPSLTISKRCASRLFISGP